MENQQQMEQLTPEQLEARRKEMQTFYESSIPYLEAQSKYERLLTEIEESRYKRATMQFQYASMMAATQPDLEEDDEEQLKHSVPPPPEPVAKAPSAGKKLKRG
jgi:predicted transcriptional regulator